MAYVVFEVGCIECVGSGRSLPEIKGTFEDRDEAVNLAAESKRSGEIDRFVYDTTTGVIAWSNQDGY